MEKPNIIYGIFKGFFGEEFVDMQNYPSLDNYISNAKCCIQKSSLWLIIQ